MFLSPLSREGGCPKSSSSDGASWGPRSWVPGCGAGEVIHNSGLWAAGATALGGTADGARHGSGDSVTDGDASDATGPGRESASCKADFGDCDPLAVLGAAAVLAGSPLPRAVRGAWADADPASPDSASVSVAWAARVVTGGAAASDSGEASGNVAALGFKCSDLLTTRGSSLISRPHRQREARRFPTQGRV